jgi:hypothetical protein
MEWRSRASGQRKRSDLIGRLKVGARRGPRLKVPVAECDRPQHLAGIENNRPRDVVVGGVVSNLGLDLIVSVLAVVQILGNDNMAVRLLVRISEAPLRNKRRQPVRRQTTTPTVSRPLEKGIIWTILAASRISFQSSQMRSLVN